MYCSDCRAATNPNYQGKVKGQKKYFPTFSFLSQAVDTTAATLRMRISHDTLQLSSRKTVTPSNDSQRGLSGNRAIIFWVQNFAAAWPTGGERCHPWTNSHGCGLVLKSFRAGLHAGGMSSRAETSTFCDCIGWRGWIIQPLESAPRR